MLRLAPAIATASSSGLRFLLLGRVLIAGSIRGPSKGRRVSLEFGDARSLFNCEVCISRDRRVALLPQELLASRSLIRSLLLGSVLISGPRRGPGTGACVNVDFGGSVAYLRSVFVAGSRRGPSTGERVSVWRGESVSFVGNRVNRGLATWP